MKAVQEKSNIKQSNRKGRTRNEGKRAVSKYFTSEEIVWRKKGFEGYQLVYCKRGSSWTIRGKRRRENNSFMVKI